MAFAFNFLERITVTASVEDLKVCEQTFIQEKQKVK